ncbi:hypothetical protein ACR6C2_35290 [Streptomyces sp. INA 01156]
MEYVADRLGLVLVKISGPALGHTVTSLDPAEAPNATARQEIEKINFALAAGNNTLLHLDDIQHTSPELLQKFIPLCDATRRVEGVWEGEPRTYDLRGKRFAVCMAGNPYTESGELFRVPDMLANRADVWNLGDVLTGKDDAFAASFVENALTANPVLAPLAGRDRADLDLLVRLAGATPRPTPTGSPTPTPHRTGPRPGRTAPPAHRPPHGPRGQRGLHRLRRPVRRRPHRAAVPPPGLLPQHEQDRPADPARHERRRTHRRHRGPLHGRGADPHHRRGGEPAQTRRTARRPPPRRPTAGTR